MLLSIFFAFSLNLTASENDNTKTTATANITTPEQALTSGAETQSNDIFRFLHHYNAKYLVSSEGDVLGKADRILSEENGIWQLNTYAKVSKYFLTLKSTEKTQFHITDNSLFVDQFYSKSKLTFKKARIVDQSFDWDNKLEIGSYNKKKWQRKLDKQVFDRVSHILQLRADLIDNQQTFNYPISYKGKVTEYIYQKEKEEIIATKMGDLNTVKLVRNKSNGDKFIVWLCPELNYLPAKIAQYEVGEPDVTLLLNELEYNPKQ